MQNNGQFSPWSQYNNPQQMGFNQGGFNQGYQNYGQGGYNNPNYNMANLSPNYGGNQQPPISFGANLNQTIANGQKFAGESKKTL